MKRALALILLLASTLVAGASAPALAVDVNTSPDRTIDWVQPHNHLQFWTNLWGHKPNLSCMKYDRGGDYITIDGGHERLVIKNDQRTLIWFKPAAGNYASSKGVSHYIVCDWDTEKKKKPVLRYGGRILGPCGDPYYTARIWNGKRSTRPVAIILEIRNGPTLWKRVLQPGQSAKPKAKWVRGGRMLVLRRGNGDIIDTERTVTGTYPWTECRNG